MGQAGPEVAKELLFPRDAWQSCIDMVVAMRLGDSTRDIESLLGPLFSIKLHLPLDQAQVQALLDALLQRGVM